MTVLEWLCSDVALGIFVSFVLHFVSVEGFSRIH